MSQQIIETCHTWSTRELLGVALPSLGLEMGLKESICLEGALQIVKNKAGKDWYREESHSTEGSFHVSRFKG